MRHSNFSKIEIKEIINLYHKGLSTIEIAIKLNCHPNSVNKYLKKERPSRYIGNINENKIIELFYKSKSYTEIANIINCSIGTITRILQKHNLCYKNTDENKKFRKSISRKLDSFFKRGLKKGCNDRPENINIDFIINYIKNNRVCYLTGKTININDTSSYHFDHKIPISKNGKNTLDNLGIACKDVNFAKRDKTPEEFIELCKEVLHNNGYKLIKE